LLKFFTASVFILASFTDAVPELDVTVALVVPVASLSTLRPPAAPTFKEIPALEELLNVTP
jgi:hypothetical protein